METLAELDGRPVLFVGGTGLYFTALTKGLADIPDIPAEAREAAEQAWAAEGEAVFRRRLATLDPAAAARIEAGDRQRLTRAMAVAEHTGRALSDWTAETTPLAASSRCGTARLELRPSALDRVARLVGELLEVLVEQRGEVLGLLVVGVLVGPRVARDQDLGRHVGAVSGDL